MFTHTARRSNFDSAREIFYRYQFIHMAHNDCRILFIVFVYVQQAAGNNRRKKKLHEKNYRTIPISSLSNSANTATHWQVCNII